MGRPPDAVTIDDGPEVSAAGFQFIAVPKEIHAGRDESLRRPFRSRRLKIGNAPRPLAWITPEISNRPRDISKCRPRISVTPVQVRKSLSDVSKSPRAAWKVIATDFPTSRPDYRINAKLREVVAMSSWSGPVITRTIEPQS